LPPQTEIILLCLCTIEMDILKALKKAGQCCWWLGC
jgi:hypothetical protein